MHFEREGQVMSEEVRLKEKVDPFKFKTWKEVMDSGKETEIHIEKEVIIEKGK